VAPRDPDELISGMRERAAELEAGLEDLEPRPARRRDEFELVLLCTGNRARSPVAEGFLRDLLADLPVRVRSLGTLELGAAPALPEAIEAAAGLGLDISNHRARALAGEDLSGADLVIGFEQRHVAAAVVDGAARRDRVFSLPELVELLEESAPHGFGEPVERARQAIADAHARRGNSLSARAELADPLGHDRTFYRDTVERVRELSERLAVGLFGEDAVRPLRVAGRRLV
jgi:low molecular weight protein-tyrosine phosphatase